MNTEVRELIQKILDLSLDTKNITVTYQESAGGHFEVSKIEKQEFVYRKYVYLKGYLYNEKEVIEDLKQMIIDLENMNK